MSCGIYKITNKINNKSYIGCSKNIEHRWIAHKSESVLENNPQYNYSIHRAFRKYGIDNFDFSIIEILPENELFDREQYWIQYYNSYIMGYNETEGGDKGPSMPGQLNPNSKLTEEDVVFIRTSLLEGKMPSEIYPLFSHKIARKGFDYVWRGESWKDILPEAIEYFKSNEYQTKVKSFAGRASITPEKIKIWNDIQDKKKKGLKRLEVYEEYKEIYSIGGFNKIWYKK